MKCCVDGCNNEGDTEDHIIPKWFVHSMERLQIRHKQVGFDHKKNKQRMCSFHNNLKGGKFLFLGDKEKEVVRNVIKRIEQQINS